MMASGAVDTTCRRCKKSGPRLLRCSRCDTSYCGKTCQTADWKRHKKQCKRDCGTATQSVSTGESKTCSVCKKVGDYVLRCSRCQKTNYCGKKCRVADWKRHKNECGGDVTGNQSASTGPPTGPEQSKSCIVCKKVGRDILRCSRCKDARYCTKSCQRADWKRHKKECKTREAEKEKQESGKECDWALEDEDDDGTPWSEDRYMYMDDDDDDELPWQSEHRNPFNLLGVRIIRNLGLVRPEYDFLWAFLGPQERQILMCKIVEVCRFWPSNIRHEIAIRDSVGNMTRVMFYLDFDFPFPYFSWLDLQEGNSIGILDPVLHLFLDGRVGIRIDEAAEVRIFKH